MNPNPKMLTLGRGMNGKGMEPSVSVVMALPTIPLPSTLAALNCGVSGAAFIRGRLRFQT